MAEIDVPLSVPEPLYQRLEKAARLAQCDVQDVIVSALEIALPSLPDNLELEDAVVLTRLALLDDETLRTIADSFLPQQQQRRYTTLLRKEEEERLSTAERHEWEGLKQTYLRTSHMKAKANFILDQRAKGRKAQAGTR